jgi:hypothetical protein
MNAGYLQTGSKMGDGRIKTPCVQTEDREVSLTKITVGSIGGTEMGGDIAALSELTVTCEDEGRQIQRQPLQKHGDICKDG